MNLCLEFILLIVIDSNRYPHLDGLALNSLKAKCDICGNEEALSLPSLGKNAAVKCRTSKSKELLGGVDMESIEGPHMSK